MKILIFRIIPYLYFQQDNFKQNEIMSKAILCKNELLSMLDEIQMETSISKRTFIDNMPFPFNNIDNLDNNFNLEKSLSRIISQLHKYLLTSTSKYFMVILKKLNQLTLIKCIIKHNFSLDVLKHLQCYPVNIRQQFTLNLGVASKTSLYLMKKIYFNEAFHQVIKFQLYKNIQLTIQQICSMFASIYFCTAHLDTISISTSIY